MHLTERKQESMLAGCCDCSAVVIVKCSPALALYLHMHIQEHATGHINHPFAHDCARTPHAGAALEAQIHATVLTARPDRTPYPCRTALPYSMSMSWWSLALPVGVVALLLLAYRRMASSSPHGQHGRKSLSPFGAMGFGMSTK